MTDEQKSHIFDDVKMHLITFVFKSGTKITRLVNEVDMQRVFTLPSDSYVFETPNVPPLAFNRDEIEHIDCRDYWVEHERTLRRMEMLNRYHPRRPSI